MKSIRPFLLVALALLALASCSTTRYEYYGPSGFVSAAYGPEVKSTSMKSLRGDDEQLVGTYDQEYERDAKGNVLKYRQTEYIDPAGDRSKFLTWETTYEVLGTQVVPRTVSLNGTVFIEVEWELLTAKATGPVVQDVPSRFFTRSVTTKDAFNSTTFYLDLDEFQVPFAVDQTLVKRASRTNYYSSLYYNYLTLGVDNVVLKRFKQSNETMIQALMKSFPGAGNKSKVAKEFQNSSFEFTYQWQVINGKICQVEQKFLRTLFDDSIDFTAAMTYDTAGRRTGETWTVINLDSKEKTPLVVFEEQLQY